MSRLTLLHINIIGVVVALIVAGGMWFMIINPAKDEQTKAEGEYNATKERADKYEPAKKALQTAKDQKVKAEADYRVFEAQYMPIIGYTNDRMTTMMRVFWPNGGKSWPERFRRTLANYMRDEQKRTGVVWLNPGVTAMGPYGPDPNAIDLGPVLHYNYAMQVRARSMAALNTHLRNWPSLKNAGVPVVSGLAVQGNSPNLMANYNLDLTIIVRDKIPAPDARVGGSLSGGGGGGGFGGGGGGGKFGMMVPGGMGGGGGMGSGGGGASAASGGGPSIAGLKGN